MSVSTNISGRPASSGQISMLHPVEPAKIAEGKVSNDNDVGETMKITADIQIEGVENYKAGDKIEEVSITDDMDVSETM